MMDSDARRHMAREVLELGQSLFDVVIDAAVGQQDGHKNEGEIGDSFPEDDVRATADEFFGALRVLLQMEEED